MFLTQDLKSKGSRNIIIQRKVDVTQCYAGEVLHQLKENANVKIVIFVMKNFKEPPIINITNQINTSHFFKDS